MITKRLFNKHATKKFNKRNYKMAKNGKPGKGRIGQVKGRSQVKNPKTGLWIKRDSGTGKFIDVKSDRLPFKGVRKEKGRP